MKAIALLLLVLLAACSTTTVVENDDDADTVIERTVVAQGDGRVVSAVTGDASQSIKVTIDSIDLYTANDWKTIAGDEDTYELRNAGLTLAGDEDIDAATYTQLRLDISSVMVGNVNAELPAEKFIIPVNLAVPAGQTTVVTAYIHGDESLSTVNGRLVFTPVVTISYCTQGYVEINGRTVVTSCPVQPTVVTYGQQPTGRVVINTVVEERTPIIVRETTIVNNTTVVYNNTVIRETPSNTTTNTTANATA